jgi:hypothetical protein
MDPRMLTLIMMAATIEIRRDGPALTVAQAQALTPEALADVLLVPGHPPVDEAIIGREGMYPPPPPGTLEATEVRFFTTPVPSSKSGFCERTEALVTLAPVMRQNRELPPAGAMTVSLTPMYRWADKAKGALSCKAPRGDFFKLDPKLGDRTFTVIRALQALKSGSAKNVQISIDDRGAREMRDFVKRNSYLPSLSKSTITPITSAREALRMFPITRVASIRLYVRVWDNGPLHEDDLKARSNHPIDAVQLIAGEQWNTGVVLQGGQIVTVRFVKAIPPPS